MATLSWYWHRLRAMSPAEVLARLRRRWHERADRAYRPQSFGVSDRINRAFPALPDPTTLPETVKTSLERDVKDLLAGRWLAFGAIPLQVDDPPRWDRDYLAGVDVPETRVGFDLDHRVLPRGADIKLIWELSRWQHLARLAMAAHALDHKEAASRCLTLLEDWVRQNPAYRGWNWTSPLEAGMRLVQFTWIDALLRERDEAGKRLEQLSAAIVPDHARFVRRHHSVGSSANNHLLGELAGLILAVTRWPSASRWSGDLDALQPAWEREVLAQFAPDGGNREQALNYHLYSFELCWQTRQALLAGGRTVDPAVEDRLRRAADFFAMVQVESEPWDYGDSDSAFVSWFFNDAVTLIREWHQWFNEPASSPALQYWLGTGPQPHPEPACVPLAEDWLHFPESGMAVCWKDDWQVRWDLSPLGYLSTAAHGHLDAMHVSLWYRGRAVVIDPGTGAYFGDPELRAHLASRDAHNGPIPRGLDMPRRLGPFLWSEPPPAPVLRQEPELGWVARLAVPGGELVRTIAWIDKWKGWKVDDQYLPSASTEEPEFTVGWHFPPGTVLEPINERRFLMKREGIELVVGLDAAWTKVELLPVKEAPQKASGVEDGICSPGFRRRALGPRIRLTARGHNPCLFRTTFLASADL